MHIQVLLNFHVQIVQQNTEQFDDLHIKRL